MLHPAALFGYSTGGAVLTLVLPLALFIVIMIGMYFVFGRRHPVPGHSTGTAAKSVAAEPQASPDADDTVVSDTVVGDDDLPADEPAAGGEQAHPE